MIGVDLIGQIRRAYFEQQRPIKEIVRTLSVSRATVRKVIRGHATEFKYERGVQPAPKLGEWVEVLTEILEKEAKLPRRERRVDPAPVRRVAWSRLRWRPRQRASLRQGLAERTRPSSGPCLCTDELRARRSLPVRLEPRDDHTPEPAADDQGSAHEAVAQAACRLCAPTSGRPRNWCSTPTTRRFNSMAESAGAASMTHEDGGGSNLCRQGAPVQPPLSADVLASPDRARGLHTRLGWEKGQVENQVGNLRDQMFRPKPRVKSLPS